MNYSALHILLCTSCSTVLYRMHYCVELRIRETRKQAKFGLLTLKLFFSWYFDLCIFSLSKFKWIANNSIQFWKKRETKYNFELLSISQSSQSKLILSKRLRIWVQNTNKGLWSKLYRQIYLKKIIFSFNMRKLNFDSFKYNGTFQ